MPHALPCAAATLPLTVRGQAGVGAVGVVGVQQLVGQGAVSFAQELLCVCGEAAAVVGWQLVGG